MAVNLIDRLQNDFSSDAIAKIGSFLGETPANTQTGLAHAVPAILATLAQKSQTSEGAADVFSMLQRGGFDGTTFGSVSNTLKSGSGATDALKIGAPLISTLFGARASGLMDWIASSAGIRAPSATSLLGIAAPFVLSMLGREATASGGFNASSIAKLLGDQWGFLRSVAPPGLANVLGLSGFGEPAKAYEPAEPARAYSPPARGAEPPPVYDRPAGGGLGWLKWALPLLLLALLIWGFAGRRNREAGREAVDATTPLSPVATTGTVALVKRKLSCGQELEMAPNGVEARLVAFIDDKGQVVPKETWMTFDRLEFETGSAALRPTSQAQIRNIAVILRCYDNVNLKIGGYTDNVGDPASNQRLSQQRAENTRQAVLKEGIEPSRLEAEGYGEQHPVASNDTEEGRQRNRRIDVLVIKK
jgi:OOP family OmpA-OmpF porin